MSPQGMLNITSECYWSEFGGCLVCPVCSFEYVHLQSVEVDQGASIATVDAVGCRLEARAKEKIGHRGSLIRLQMWCESGHVFSQVFRFHKGMTFVRVDVEEAVTGDELCSLPELWRD
jgi:hypothetical protein